MTNEKIEKFIHDLPDPEAARRFFANLSRNAPADAKILERNHGLLSDVLTISAFSPLLATTLLQNPKYFKWLGKQRSSTIVREKEELLESLGRFALMNSQVETNILLSRFRRRELIRIYLKDIRGLGTIAEITQEISNLADAILEHALVVSRQELDNRYGNPLEKDSRGKTTPAQFCIVSLGKLGSKELNYSSDIDLLFLYSNDGSTSGQGSRGSTTNREYFVKLAEFITQIVGRQTGEGAAYRVDLRLRPHGRVGALAISLKEAEKYYKTSAQMWERQVMIRSRASAGAADVFHRFFDSIRDEVFSRELSVEKALENVRLSKEKIDLEKTSLNGFDVKLGRGGIREIEFIAQALQLGKGGSDKWLRSPHTLISLSRLADRKLVGETELTQLSDAYNFLRRVEHRLQMEHGLQTHLIPLDPEKRLAISLRMGFPDPDAFQMALEKHTTDVNAVFTRIFGEEYARQTRRQQNEVDQNEFENPVNGDIRPILSSIEKSDFEDDLSDETLLILKGFAEISPPFSARLAANPALVGELPKLDAELSEKDYFTAIRRQILKTDSYAESLAVFRQVWAKIILKIAFFDIFEKTDLKTIRSLQTRLAEASIENAILITRSELSRHFTTDLDKFPFAVLGLGKLGGGGMDYGSDLDLVLIYDDEEPCPVTNLTRREFFGKAVEIFVNTLSGLTRDGSLYRVDLRLRPDGKNGANSIGRNALFSYLENRSVIWEWLAYVKLRGVAGDPLLASKTEENARRIIHINARNFDQDLLRSETRRIRERLERAKSNARKGKEIDIKYGEGGLQDIYFSIRFLQLSGFIPDDPENRSTLFSLERLFDHNLLNRENFENLTAGYTFLSELDHNLRLTNGRSTRLPIANHKTLKIISERMKTGSITDFMEKLTFHRINVHSAFQDILKKV